MTQLPLKTLRRQWLWVAFAWVSILFISYVWLNQVWPYAQRWLIFSSIVQIYGLWILWRHLPLNHRAGESALFTTLGTANHLSLIRGLLASLVAGFLFLPWPTGILSWLPSLLYLVAYIIDYFDGYYARRNNQVTLLGTKLDIEFDGLNMFIVNLLAIWYGQLDLWFLSISLAYHFFVLGMEWRRRQGKPLYDLTPSFHRRAFAGFLMAFACTALMPFIPAFSIKLASFIFGGAVGLGFIRDWLVVSGRLDPQSERYLQVQRAIFVGAVYYTPILLRVCLLGSVLIFCTNVEGLPQPQSWLGLLTSWQLPWPPLWATLVSGLALMGIIGTTLGILGRVAAFFLLFALIFDMNLQGLQFYNGIAWFSTCALILLGTGSFSLWQPRVNQFVLWV